MQRSNEAWGSGKDPEARQAALVADVVTSPVQVPVIAAVSVGSTLGYLAKGGENNKVAGVAAVRLRVLDDEGQPVSGVRATLGTSGQGKRGPIPKEATGADGYFPKTLAVARMKGAGLHVTKEGYYETRLPDATLLIPRQESQPKEISVVVELKRIKNPVPMYARKVEKGLPVLNETIGYDLMLGDWTPPHGQGQNADFVLFGTLDKRGEDDFDFELRLTFSRTGDGIQRMPDEFVLYRDGSLYWAPAYEAPAEGYVSEWRLRRWRHGRDRPIQSTFNMKSGYYFRARSELDGDGRAVKALYGKIRGDFFSFTYYLNPDGTRNVEYDPQRNLLRPAGSRDRAYDLAP